MVEAQPIQSVDLEPENKEHSPLITTGFSNGKLFLNT